MWGRLCRRPAEVPFDGGRPWEPWRFECRRAAENVALKEQWAVFFFLFSGFRLSTRHSKERENVKVMFLETDVVGCLRLSTLSLVIILQCWDGGEALLSICICFVLYARCKKVHCEIIKLNTREGMCLYESISSCFYSDLVMFLTELSPCCQPANISTSQMITVKTTRDECVYKFTGSPTTLFIFIVLPREPPAVGLPPCWPSHYFDNYSDRGALTDFSAPWKSLNHISAPR